MRLLCFAVLAFPVRSISERRQLVAVRCWPRKTRRDTKISARTRCNFLCLFVFLVAKKIGVVRETRTVCEKLKRLLSLIVLGNEVYMLRSVGKPRKSRVSRRNWFEFTLQHRCERETKTTNRRDNRVHSIPGLRALRSVHRDLSHVPGNRKRKRRAARSHLHDAGGGGWPD